MLNLINKYSDFNFFTKVIVLFIGSLSISTYIAFLTEYSTYYYAWQFGVRLPVEGMPYLKTTVTLTSFLMIVSCISIFILIFKLWNLNVAAWHSFGNNNNFHGMISILVKNGVQKSGWVIFFLASIFSSIFWGGLLGLIVFYTFGEEAYPKQIAVITGLLVLIHNISLWRPKLLIVFSLITSLIVFLAVPVMLFNTEIHSALLYQFGYGGKLPVIIKLPNNSNTSQVNLFLRTNSSLFIYSSNNSIIEYPIMQIKYIEYHNDKSNKANPHGKI